MSSTTTNLHLVKPSGVDQVDIDVINSNMDLIDTAVKSAENPIAVAAGSNTYAAGVNQLTFNDAGIWKGLDEVRLYNGTDALYCKQGVTTGLLMQDNQIKVVPVTWNGNVPAVGTMKGYISADGNYHLYDSSTSADSTSLATLRDSVSTQSSSISTIQQRLFMSSNFLYFMVYDFALTENFSARTAGELVLNGIARSASDGRTAVAVGTASGRGTYPYFAMRYPHQQGNLYGVVMFLSIFESKIYFCRLYDGSWHTGSVSYA